jgi:hypothetical protein
MSRDIKYIGYLESQIADTMWPSGLCREETKPFHKVCLRLETAGFAPPTARHSLAMLQAVQKGQEPIGRFVADEVSPIG